MADLGTGGSHSNYETSSSAAVTSHSDISALIERLEKATGPDRVIDEAIHEAVVGPIRYGDPEVPAYTFSVDAALTLVPDTHAAIMEWGYRDILPEALLLGAPDAHDTEDQERVMGRASTIALALCIAALKARAAIRKAEGG